MGHSALADKSRREAAAVALEAWMVEQGSQCVFRFDPQSVGEIALRMIAAADTVDPLRVKEISHV